MTVPPGTGERNRTRPKDCTGCARPLVGEGAGPAPEGFVRYKARGLCKSCYELGRRGPYQHRSADPCAVCGVTMCSRKQKPAEGQRRYGGKGLCDLCYERAYREAGGRRGGPTATVEDIDARRTASHAAGLASYIRARRARGWPDDGTLTEIPL